MAGGRESAGDVFALIAVVAAVTADEGAGVAGVADRFTRGVGGGGDVPAVAGGADGGVGDLQERVRPGVRRAAAGDLLQGGPAAVPGDGRGAQIAGGFEVDGARAGAGPRGVGAGADRG